MANHVSHGALPYPVKNARFSVLIPFLDADGDPTDPTTPDTEVSLDNAAFADCAEEVATATGSNGVGYLTLTGAETNASLVALAAKVASGPKATLLTLYPRVLPVIFSGTASAGAAGTITLASSAPAITDMLLGCIVKTTGGTGGGGTGGANNQARVITAYTSGRVASVTPNWETTPDNTTTYEILLTELAMISLADVRMFNAVAGTFSSGRPEVNTSHVAGTSQTARDLGAQLDAAITTRLAPTTAGRTLDVTATGEAGIDWANIGSPTTVVALSGTTVKTATDVETDTADIQSRLPAALVSGRIDASVGAVASGVITAAAIADGAIDRATFAADTGLQTIRSNTAQTALNGTITLDASASATDDFYKGAVVYLTGGTGAGQARVIASYVGGTRVATLDRNWTTTPDNTSTFAIIGQSAPKLSSALEVTAASVTGNVGGNVTGSVGSIANGGIAATSFAPGAIDATAIAADAIGSSELAASAVTEIQSGLATASALTTAQADLDDIQTRLPAALVSGRIDASVGAMANDVVTAAAIAADAIGSSELAASAVTEIQSGLSTLDAAGVRTAVGLASANLDTQLAAIDDAVDTEVGAIKAVTDKLDTALELDGAVYRYTTNALEQAPTGGSAPTAADIADAVWDESLAAHLTAGSTGAGLNAAGSAGDPWSTALPGAYGAGTAGKIVGDNLNATVSSRSTLTAAQVNTEADTALADVGLTSTVTGRIDAAISSRLASGTVSADVTAIKAKTDNLPAAPAATGDIPSAATVASQVRTELTTELGRMDAAVSTRATPAQVNNEVVDALTVDASAEPTAVPAADAPVSEKLAWLYALGRNRVLQTSSAQTLRNDADSGDIASANVSDDGTTFERSGWQ